MFIESPMIWFINELPSCITRLHDDVMKRKHFPRYWPFVREIPRLPVNFPQKASVAVLWCFLWSAREQTVELTIHMTVIERPSCLLWRHCNDKIHFSPMSYIFANMFSANYGFVCLHVTFNNRDRIYIIYFVFIVKSLAWTLNLFSQD